jgi:hypothetical protein
MAHLASELNRIKHPATKTFWRFEDWQKRVHSTKLAQLERAQLEIQHAEVLRLDELLTEFESKYGIDKYTSLSGKIRNANIRVFQRMQSSKSLENPSATPYVTCLNLIPKLIQDVEFLSQKTRSYRWPPWKLT